ncbi:glutamate--cysteine ligase [Georgenia sp. SYP-B2076]|uniref:carboxylate-amine ligase n=1 Tax=Georgenia sp. SYP-B2076 TaxID=2495881 RepID=UPI000F8F2842|nr:glutamate--cysteine ligase [Georgenia sp. SYP-B2076]
MRTVGVEEEFLLVDPESGQALAVAAQVLAEAKARAPLPTVSPYRDATGSGPVDTPGGRLVHEMGQEQVESGTRPHTSLAELEDELCELRRRAEVAAAAAGAGVAALATSPLPVRTRVVTRPRYEAMARRYGLTAREHLLSGCHVHVAVDSRDEAVGVLDRVRVWLPSLLALSANSPFWQGVDTGYASYRSPVMLRWPSAGPTEIFGSAAAYDALVADMLASRVLHDAGMVYFDARASYRYPTVEIRTADVCLRAADAVLVAALCRALVETAAAEWASGEPAPPVRAAVLRLASWQAACEGIDGVLLDPLTARPVPSSSVLAALVTHVRPALRAYGDEGLVDERLTRVLARGNGARRQRAVLRRTGSLADVVADAVRVTAGRGDQDP